MDKDNKLTRPQTPGENAESELKASTTSPSRGSDHKPVSENDNSANLFEEHIRETKKDE